MVDIDISFLLDSKDGGNMKNDTKIILIIVGIILAWLVLNGTIDVGLFSSVPSTPVASPSMGGLGGVIK